MKATRRESTRNRHQRVRRRVQGTAERPRLAVFRSNHHIYAQVIDDERQHTLAAASTVEPALKQAVASGATCEASVAVGKLLAERALAQGVTLVVFDRGGKLFHGRVRALADAAREAGLEF
ncbi:50S ribosomal protein L18 [Synechococcales cyanobacterium C]|uniref:Large ribosomal subunit protein uL18 n=1 Tax=Petrachloros mirabilis ULC683 TaxID=2781853 RepID=A0A8K2A1M8_9CYAN|nr:50S ribosomal protein L18 [Petrachloros mirabilis]NCJ08033.1 50S ribosomal protein L18 [Petrachloros mirabilis ULC683]